jgi:surface polysaccharide O-acyltransferase-like enzyme
MHDTPPPPRAAHLVDNTDWLKTAAIILVVVDHIGYFFIEHDQWWSVFGRLAAPVFFFLIGYAQTRTVPLHWLWLGVILTLLDSSNNGWSWVAPNILLSFAFIRVVRPYVRAALDRYGWLAFGLLVAALFAALPLAAPVVDYGAEGWLWALLGLCQRLYVEGRPDANVSSVAQGPALPTYRITENAGLMRILACFAAAIVYVWQEQRVYMFPQIHLAVFILGVGILILSLCLFRRGPSRVQPPEPMAGVLRYIGRHTLEIYAIQLAGSEIIVKLVPSIAL